MTVVVVPYNADWKSAFALEAGSIGDALGEGAIQLHHIGSTSIPGIFAKPIIDILGVVDDLAGLDAQTSVFQSLGYEAMGAYGIKGRRYYRKTNGEGRRTHHLHAFQTGSPHIERHLAFRDYIKAHPEVAAEYSALKSKLAEAAQASWDTYVDGKAPFVTAVETEAVKWYRQTRD